LQYNQEVFNTYKSIDNGEVYIEDLQCTLFNKAGWKVEYEPYTENDIKAKPGTYDYQCEKRIMDSNNAINMQSTQYLCVAFNVLMSMGYGKHRLTRVKDKVVEMFNRYSGDDRESVMVLHKRLFDEAGVYVQMPDVREEVNNIGFKASSRG
jgi:hypothetical protein